MGLRTLLLAEIIVDPAIQQRVDGLNYETVNEYAADYDNGATLPPIDVFESKAGVYLADGFHRYESMKSLGYESVKANVHEGTRTDAILFACAANATNGLRRTNKDKRKAVRTLLELFPKRSDRWIAEKAGVDHHTVASVKDELGKIPSSHPGEAEQEGEGESEPEEEKTVGRDGKARRKPKRGGSNGQSPPRFPAWECFEQYMLNMAGVTDGLLARYDRSVKVMLESPEWNPACNDMAIRYCDECIKTLQSLRREFKQYV